MSAPRRGMFVRKQPLVWAISVLGSLLFCYCGKHQKIFLSNGGTLDKKE